MNAYIKPDAPGGKALPPLRVLLPQLQDAAGNKYSQFGEDGLIAALFGVIGVTNKWCFEVGAADGELHSNTKALWEDGWSALLIEKDPAYWPKLKRWMDITPDVTAMQRELTDLDTLDVILTEAGAPIDLDLGVIDIDGQDYWVWSDMLDYRPRVMLVEYSPYRKEIVYDDDERLMITDGFCPRRGAIGQAGITPICWLGAQKGYKVVAITSVNVLFVKKELLAV